MLTEPKNEEFTTSVFTQNGNCYYDGYWQNERYFKNIRNKVLATFCPITVSEKNIEYGKLLKNKKASVYMCVEVIILIIPFMAIYAPKIII